MSPDDLILRTDLSDVPGGAAQYGAGPGSTWLDVTMKPALSAAAETAVAWDASLIAYGRRAQALRDGEPATIGLTLSEQRADGTQKGLSGGPIAFHRSASRVGGPTVSEATLRGKIQAGLVPLGLTDASVTFVRHPRIDAPVVVAQVGGGAFVQRHPFAAEVLGTGDTPIFMEVVRSDGSAVEAVGYIPLAGETDHWQDPSLGCFSQGPYCGTQP